MRKCFFGNTGRPCAALLASLCLALLFATAAGATETEEMSGAVTLGTVTNAATKAPLSSGEAASARAAAPCVDVEVVGLRGSSESYLGSEHGMGSLLGPVADTIATQLSGSLTFGFYGVPYRAADAIKGVLTGDYFDSKDEGSGMLHDYLLQRISDCPSIKFVVMGYSQGAHSAGDLLAREGSLITDHVASLVMFGDPRFNPAASYDWGTFDSRDHGIAGARSLSDFAGWHSRVISFCHRDDIVCQGASIWFDHGTGAHEQERYLNDYGDLTAGLIRRRLGLTQLPRVPLDLAFVLDSTGSMGSSIYEVREAISGIVNKLEEKESDFRVALVDYKDTDQGDPYAVQLDLDLSADVSAFTSAVDSISVYGGGDYPEAVYSGLMAAFTELSWRSDSRKAVILLGDAPAKDPEPITGFTMDSVLAAASALPGALAHSAPLSRSLAAAAEGSGDKATIYPLAIGEGPLETFEVLASGSGGQVFEASGSSAVSDQLLKAVAAAALPVEVVLSSAAAARPGTPISFKAGANYAGGEIVSYGWDFDEDGTIDETTSAGDVTHSFPDPFEGEVEVIATADDAHHGSATTHVQISEDAPVPASAPTVFRATSTASNSVHLSWQPPSDLGGGSLLGYQLILRNGSSGDIEASHAVAAGVQQLDIEHLPAATYLATLAATTEAGFGAEAELSSTVEDLASPDDSSKVGLPATLMPTQPLRQSPLLKCRKGFKKKKVRGKRRCVKRHRKKSQGRGRGHV